jgi:hypothetical protein
MTMLVRCAIISTVEFLNFLLMVRCIISSVSKSTLAVASSRVTILAFFKTALTKHNCLCPTLKLLPPEGKLETKSFSSTSSKAFQSVQRYCFGDDPVYKNSTFKVVQTEKSRDQRRFAGVTSVYSTTRFTEVN